MNKQTYIYRIDAEDRILNTSENWKAYADEISPAQTDRPETVVGALLWDFIQDIETKHLYTEIFRHVRTGKDCGPIPFRCDSPEERRWLELRFLALPENKIEIQSRIVRTEPRPPVKLLMQDIPRSQDFVSLCSMCKKIKVAEDQWVEIEKGLSLLKIFEAEKMPSLTHGLCKDCYRRTMAELKKLHPLGNQ